MHFSRITRRDINDAMQVQGVSGAHDSRTPAMPPASRVIFDALDRVAQAER
jgi:hypothetical protein